MESGFIYLLATMLIKKYNKGRKNMQNKGNKIIELVLQKMRSIPGGGGV